MKKLWMIGCIAALGAGYLIWKGDGTTEGGVREDGEFLYRKNELNERVPRESREVFVREGGENDEPKGFERPVVREEPFNPDTLNRQEREEPKVITRPVKPEGSPSAEPSTFSVPFQAQAPFGDWSQPWADACEEASLVIANRFTRGLTTLSREEMRDEILKLVAFQNERYGDYKDSDAHRTAEIGEEVYGMKMEVREVTGINDAVEVLKQGKLIIAPMAGRVLKNPYFRPPGPLYHMIVVGRYDDAAKEFISHDVGTRRGEGFGYSSDVFWDALHDFPGEKERILEGKKRIIVVGKK